jgi:hypothetical protein
MKNQTMSHMNKYLLLLLTGLLLVGQPVHSQITLSLALNSRPQPWLSDWVNPVNGQMIITYSVGTVAGDPSVKLRTTLLDQNGTILGKSNVNAARLYILKTGVNLFTMADALQLQNLILTGSVQILLQRTGRLAAGQYQLMVEVMDNTGELVRAKQTRPFTMVSYQLPVLISPVNDTGLDAHIAQNIITFRWTSLAPLTQEIPVYRVQVFEILPGQTPMQAFRSNMPLLDEPATKGSTQYLWQTSLPMLDSTANKKFIWTIQTLDSQGQPIPTADMNLQGRSDPGIFNIVNQMNTNATNKKNEAK